MPEDSPDATAETVVHLLMAVPFAVSLLAYLVAVYLSRHRGYWPWYRSVLWTFGIVACAAGVAGPLAERAESSFPAHMWSHLVMGMVGPVALVLAAPFTLALRTLNVRWARVLARVLVSAPFRFVTHPVTAGVLSLGGLWVLYTTPLYAAAQEHVAVHVLVHMHILISSYLFTNAIIGIDPNRHRMKPVYRAVVLVVFMAGHRVLAKHIYANPPPVVPLDQGQVGAMIMYYGGDLLDSIIILVLCFQWYSSRRPAMAVRTPAVPG
jgi:putative membrane protein